MHSHTYTYVELEVSAEAYDEIAGKLRAAGYGHVFGKDRVIDMQGIALTCGRPALPNALPVISSKTNSATYNGPQILGVQS